MSNENPRKMCTETTANSLARSRAAGGEMPGAAAVIYRVVPTQAPAQPPSPQPQRCWCCQLCLLDGTPTHTEAKALVHGREPRGTEQGFECGWSSPEPELLWYRVTGKNYCKSICLRKKNLLVRKKNGQKPQNYLIL